jgi:hypothetical protein
VKEDVDGSEPPHDLVDELPDLGLAGDVGAYRDGGTTAGGDLPGDLLPTLRVAGVDDDDLGRLAAIGPGNGPADPLGTAGDDRHLVL